MTIQKVDITTVVLVNKNGEKIGLMGKLDAHKGKGFLHRAISVFIFDSRGNLLIQKRFQKKYHSGGLWSNTACSHVYDGEDIKTAAYRSLSNEMGITNVFLSEFFSFIYKESVDNNLIEYEYDHVFVGFSDEKPVLNFLEVSEYKYESLSEILKDIEINPNIYASWFKIILKEHATKIYSGLKKFQREK